jgi:hypothetical protein
MTSEDTVDSDRSLTRRQFCEAENISLSTYHKLKRAGLGPVETCFKGMGLARITAMARRKWHADNEKWNSTKEAELEKQRRIANASLAGREAAKSERHVSKRGKTKAKTKPKVR